MNIFRQKTTLYLLWTGYRCVMGHYLSISLYFYIIRDQSVKDVFFFSNQKKFHKDEEVAACDFTSLLTRMCRHE